MKNNTPQRTFDSPTNLSPAARVRILQEVGLGSGWVLTTMTEMGNILQNLKAYKEERRELVAAAYAMRDAIEELIRCAPHEFEGVPRAVACLKARLAADLPLPPRPVKKPDNPAAPP